MFGGLRAPVVIVGNCGSPHQQQGTATGYRAAAAVMDAAIQAGRAGNCTRTGSASTEFGVLPLLVPPTSGRICRYYRCRCVQQFKLFELLVPPTEPEFRQQGLRQELATAGNTATIGKATSQKQCRRIASRCLDGRSQVIVRNSVRLRRCAAS